MIRTLAPKENCAQTIQKHQSEKGAVMDTTKELPRETYDESNGLSYTLVGDYYLPDLAPSEESYTPDVWARQRLRYLREHKRALYTLLKTEGKLNAHLREIDEQADEMQRTLTTQMMKREGVTEDLKEHDQMRWVGLVNNIASRVREVISTTLIYT